MQRIVSLDSQILNSIQLCERRTQYAFVDSIAPAEKAEALERGDLIHKMLEIHNGLISNCARHESDTWVAMREFGLTIEVCATNPLEYAVKAARLFAAKMSLPTEEVEECIFQFKEYSDFYKHDTWETLAIEEVGAKVLFEDDYLKVIYNFKIDRLARNGSIIAPWDYKTSKRRTETSSLSNQFIGYAWGTDSSYVVIDKIGFQKTLKREERFQRIILPYEQERITEWQQNAIHWAFVYDACLNTGKFTMNLTSCDKYSGCIYRPICEKGPSSRQWVIERDFQPRETWDPAKYLEAK